ncbi:ParA family protein [Spirosoma agri]|uniref:ParA family protein n=1 Tax=Spirosoma agri TaxID=1987381 RepID=A0A6M0IT80_9BACT|nr:ParA family protein [Spirosoma agri]NEU70831.1 ParA family protein [Spirosoma agri]
MITNQEVIDFLSAKAALSLAAIEKEANLSASTLTKAISGQRVLNSKHLQALEPVLIQYGLNEYKNRKARVISIVNHKGGVGKTTTTINFGRALNLLGYRILMIDMDSQGNLSQSLGVDSPEQQLLESLVHNQPLPITAISPNFDLVPSNLQLAKYERDLTHSPSGALRLKTALNAVLSQYDFILIDCPPALNIFTNSALIASTSALVVLEPETSAVKGVNNLFELIEEIRQFFNERLAIDGILMTRVDRRLLLHKEIIQSVRKDLAAFTVFTTEIRLNAALKESQYAQEDIFRYNNSSPGAQDYKQLAAEYLAIHAH